MPDFSENPLTRQARVDWAAEHLCIENCWVFGLLPSSGILKNRKHDVSEIGSVSDLR
jgi:hypothetical protein